MNFVASCYKIERIGNMNKSILRNRYKEIRRRIKNKELLDNSIFNRVIELKEYKQAKLILIYVALKEEVDTLKIIEYSLKAGKRVAVPKCEGDNIVFYRINTLSDLEEGSFRILEPKTNEVINNFTDSICIIPGIAFDKENNRLGYGRGFYDRFLEKYEGTKIGLTYKECICDKIDGEITDIKMDKIIFN